MKKLGSSLLLFTGLLAAANAGATILTINLTTEFSGGQTPAGTYTAIFDDTACGANCVQLTMQTEDNGSSEFINGQNDFGWGFNFNPAKDVSLLSFLFVSGNNADSIQKAQNAFKADGDGFYDILFSWDAAAASRLDSDTDVVYNITGIAGLTVSDFNFLSCGQPTCAGAGGNQSFTSAAHVQGIGAQANGSGFIGGNPNGGGPPTGVPEPASLLLLGSGLMVMGLGRRFRKGKA